ncbi:putative 4-carboxymuconolactone decarboxylase family protein [Phaeomoniella chlamydospora]|uniref:Putative 4-carboxymuconolactone decarboxylase family protein n=1 Tax=Phaeomoniella chlamydospora TaxID=158046 RepID=A0A0G2E6Y0_PHACM|nr:putative 4-carboxymuconolactone decarboxylase family protein [Phaeomoniella chlamydospora]
MRLPYAPNTPPPASTDPETHAIYTRISSRRHPRPLIPLDLTLLHSPPVADGYNAFVGALRTKTIFPASLLELAICRIAVLNSAVYEWDIHAAIAVKEGIPKHVLEFARFKTPDEVENHAFADHPTDQQDSHSPDLTPAQIVTLWYTDELTRKVKVQDPTFEKLKSLFNEREIVELTTTIAGYNCVSRILVGLDVGENNGKEMKNLEELYGK